MKNNDDLYIGSLSPTIGVIEVRKLTEVTKTVSTMLTKEEFVSIMQIYGQALDRIMKENNVNTSKEE